jgi:hypothetical protein
VQNDTQVFGLSPDVVKQSNLKGTCSRNHDCLFPLSVHMRRSSRTIISQLGSYRIPCLILVTFFTVPNRSHMAAAVCTTNLCDRKILVQPGRYTARTLRRLRGFHHPGSKIISSEFQVMNPTCYDPFIYSVAFSLAAATYLISGFNSLSLEGLQKWQCYLVLGTLDSKDFQQSCTL